MITTFGGLFWNVLLSGIILKAIKNAAAIRINAILIFLMTVVLLSMKWLTYILCPLCFFPWCSLWWKKTPRRTQWEETQGTQLNTNHNRGPLEYHFSILSIENPNPLNLLLQK